RAQMEAERRGQEHLVDAIEVEVAGEQAIERLAGPGQISDLQLDGVIARSRHLDDRQRHPRAVVTRCQTGRGDDGAEAILSLAMPGLDVETPWVEGSLAWKIDRQRA